MDRYNVNDWVETKYGIGQIKRVWTLNPKVTVFDVKHFKDDKVRYVFYGEINKVLYRG